MQRRAPFLQSPLLSVLPRHHPLDLEAKESGESALPYNQGAETGTERFD